MRGKINSIANISNAFSLIKGRIPGQVIIQYTDRCNGKCPQCGMRFTEKYERSKLPQEEVKKIIYAASKQGVQALSFTGGEPFLYEKEILNLIEYAGNCNIKYIRTGTNGFMFMDSENANFKDKIKNFAEKLSETKLRNFWISIDSMDTETHENMRGLKGVIKGIEKALPIFHEYGLYPAANLGINRNTGGIGNIPEKMEDDNEFYSTFRNAFRGFYDFVIDLGFTMVNACYPMSIDNNSKNQLEASYGANSTNNIVAFSNREKIQIFKALIDTIPEYRSKIRLFTPLVSLYSMIKQYEGFEEYSLPCRGGIDFFFVSVKDGDTYPCGFRGNNNMGKLYDMNVKGIKKEAFCRRCDWECFRDPSEMMGYLIKFISNPIASIIKNEKDQIYRKLWREDIDYYNACDLFDGRRNMNKKKLKKFLISHK